MRRALSTLNTSMERSIISKLSTQLSPLELQVTNESYKHNVPKDSETHFKVLIVSEIFHGKSLIQKHRLVNTILSDEFAHGLHALSIQAMSPDDWMKDNTVKSTPPCAGGHK